MVRLWALPRSSCVRYSTFRPQIGLHAERQHCGAARQDARRLLARQPQAVQELKARTHGLHAVRQHLRCSNLSALETDSISRTPCLCGLPPRRNCETHECSSSHNMLSLQADLTDWHKFCERAHLRMRCQHLDHVNFVRGHHSSEERPAPAVTHQQMQVWKATYRSSGKANIFYLMGMVPSRAVCKCKPGLLGRLSLLRLAAMASSGHVHARDGLHTWQ